MLSHLGNMKAGDCYQVTGTLFALSGELRTEQGANLDSLKKWAVNFKKDMVLVPLGTTFKIESIVRRKRSSWNTGNYEYLTIMVVGLSGEFKGQHLDASALASQHEARVGYKWDFGITPAHKTEWPTVEVYPERTLLTPIPNPKPDIQKPSHE